MGILQLSSFPLVMGSLTSLLRLNFVWPVGIMASWPCRGDDTQQAAVLPEPAASPEALSGTQLSVLSPSVKVVIALVGPQTREGSDPRTG